MYGSVAGVLIFIGEKVKMEMSGTRFVNTRTNQPMEYNMKMHMKFFFIQEEKNFGMVILICIIMSVILTCFLGYHLRLAWNNMTTNESAKKDQCRSQLKREERILKIIE
mgnify:CR=1 FL=1